MTEKRDKRARLAAGRARNPMKKGGYYFSEQQAQAILDLRLNRLSGLEQDKIVTDYSDILKRIVNLLEILSNPDKLMKVIQKEGIKCSVSDLETITNNNYPDVRKMLNTIQVSTQNNNLKLDKLSPKA